MGQVALYVPGDVQREAHYCDAREILYGGTQNCGKTWFLRWDCIMTQLYDWNGSPGEFSRYLDAVYKGGVFKSKGWALHLRRTFKMLTQTISRVLDFVYEVDPEVHWDADNYILTFGCGYRWQFGHCQNDDDWRQYDTNEYCVEESTDVLMGDGEYKKIRDIVPGDFVATLEGPRIVTHFHSTGRKPCVSLSAPLLDGTIGKQIHPTTHPVLVSSTMRWRPGLLRGELQAESQSTAHAFSWLDYESMLCGRAESPVKRVSTIDGGTGFLEFDGSRIELSRLPELSFPLVLHEPSHPSDGTFRQIPTRFHEFESLREPSIGSLQFDSRHTVSTREDLSRSLRAFERVPRNISGIHACGTACAHAGSGTATGSMGRCSICYDLRGALAHSSQGIFQEQSLRLGDAESNIPIGWRQDGQERTRTDMGHSQQSYRHFYSRRLREVTEGVRTVEAKVRFHGFAETCDLTVEGANHYITRFGIVNANSHIAFDEAIQFTETQYNMIRNRLRCSDPILSSKRRVVLATNPDAPAEGVWVKKRFVDHAPEGRKMLTETMNMTDGTVEKRRRIFFPAYLSDNPDKESARQTEIDLRSQPRHIMEARLFGNWNFVAGSFFEYEWRTEVHVVKPFTCPAHGLTNCQPCAYSNGLPNHWPRARVMDWGYKKACPNMWFAKNEDDDLIFYREVTYNHEIANEKDRRDAQLVALGIKKVEMEHGEWNTARNCSKLTGPADYQICARMGSVGDTIEDTMAKEGVYWCKSTKNRAAATAEILRRLKDVPSRPGARPALMVFENCTQLRRIMPLIKVDPSEPELPLKDDNGHWLECLMYACMYSLPKAEKASGKGRHGGIDEDDDEGDEKQRRGTKALGGYGS